MELPLYRVPRPSKARRRIVPRKGRSTFLYTCRLLYRPMRRSLRRLHRGFGPNAVALPISGGDFYSGSSSRRPRRVVPLGRGLRRFYTHSTVHQGFQNDLTEEARGYGFLSVAPTPRTHSPDRLFRAYRLQRRITPRNAFEGSVLAVHRCMALQITFLSIPPDDRCTGCHRPLKQAFSTDDLGPNTLGGALPLGRCSRRFWRAPVGEIAGTQDSAVLSGFIHTRV